MQEIPAVKSAPSDIYDQLRAAALVDMSSQTRAFSDFLNLLSRPATDNAACAARKADMLLALDAPQRLDEPAPRLDAAAPQDASGAVRHAAESTAQAAQTAAQTASQAGQAAASARQNATDSRLAAAKNVPVSREAFEEIRPALARLGLSESEVEDLRARSQAGQLTWGQMVQSLAGRMTGAKKPVELSASQSLDLQSFFQKLGFAPDASQALVADVARGAGAKVLAQIQKKLSTMSEDQTLSLDSKEMATLLKALRLPEGSANKLAQLLGPDTTVAGLKGALALAGQELLQQRAQGESQDTDLLRSLAKIMQKDVDKTRREAGLPTDKAGQQPGKDAEQPHISVEVKGPDRNDTKWFDKHDQQKRAGGEEASWREFLARVRVEDGAGQPRQPAQSGKDALDALLGKAGLAPGSQQTKAENAQQAKTWEKIATPKLLAQVQEAMLKDLGQGRKQMTLNLDPESLGKMQIMLQVKGKEVNAVLRAEDSETAKLLTSQLETIRKTLEDQGLKVQNLEVQTGLASRQDQQLFSTDQHNQAQERQELSNMFSRLRLLRSDGEGLAQDMQNAGMQAILSDQGLHIIA
ncbi:MAG: flagellar hook-length control protein FliK [Proteobacteria bacterium]|nr:flagellar hook-length control protein FliK [Pseudomonadota bacterium]MBU1596280.1 flagellar hook-length control protein FliK [Pseudomonadota bacterium]